MKKHHLLVTLFFTIVCIPAFAEDSPKDACKSAAELYADGDLNGALEEAKWCVTLIEQEKQQQLSGQFPEEVMGYQGAEVESQNAMGFSMTSREYSKGDSYIKVTLNGGSSGSALNAFSALAQMGMSAGGGEKLRIQKRTAMLMDNSGDVQIMVTLKKGGMLMFESNNTDADIIKDFANAFPVAQLDDSRE